MHHGQDLPEDLRKEVQQEQLGATGEFPEGKLTPRDKGVIRIAVTCHNDQVVIVFGTPVTWIGFDPAQARELADCLIEKAEQCRR